jgi:two-component system sensor histidine kinase PrrB
VTYTPSLRVRVAVAAAIGAAVVAGAIVGGTWASITREGYDQLDSQLRLAGALTATGRAQNAPTWIQRGDNNEVIGTVRSGRRIIISTDVVAPPADDGLSTVDIGGTSYRVRTTERDMRALGGEPVSVSVGLPTQPTDERISHRHRIVLGLAVLAVVAAAILGWLLGGLATRPFRQLAAHPSDPDHPGRFRGPGGAKEADQINAALSKLLAQLDSEHMRTQQALSGARDFAALSAHELRTPLTSMRTDLDLLRATAVDPERFRMTVDQRAELINRLTRGHRRLTDTLGALEQLAQGELADAGEFDIVDLTDLCDQVVIEQRRQHPAVDIALTESDPVQIKGFAPGLRIAVDNAITNARVHGRADEIVVSVQRDGDRALIIIDDNGSGLPAAERAAVFGRFERGSSAQGPGTGLGLALIAQQAVLHNGSAHLLDSPLGGLRLVVQLAVA